MDMINILARSAKHVTGGRKQPRPPYIIKPSLRLIGRPFYIEYPNNVWAASAAQQRIDVKHLTKETYNG